MKIVSLLNQKGGVGKSTTAVNLSVALTKLDKTVLLIDLDPQGDSTDYSGVIGEQRSTTFEFLLDGIDARIKTRHYDFIPSDIVLADFDLKASSMIARENILKEAIINLKCIYDYVIIDCPPSLGLLPINALAASDLVISPVLVEKFSIKGINSLMDTISSVKKINKNIKVKFLINKYNKSYIHNTQNYTEIKEKLSALLFATILRQDVRISQSQYECLNIFDYDNKSKAARDYAKLAVEVASNE